jgi:hypothetical protein
MHEFAIAFVGSMIGSIVGVGAVSAIAALVFSKDATDRTRLAERINRIIGR